MPAYTKAQAIGRKLLTKAQWAQLRENYKTPDADHRPVVKLFTPTAGCTWLIQDSDDRGRMFGLCDLGVGYPELGYVTLEDLEKLVGPYGIGVERDKYFEADRPMSAYVAEAEAQGRIAA